MAKETKHTPGPWKYVPEALQDDRYHIAGRGPMVVHPVKARAEVRPGTGRIANIARNSAAGRDGEAEANARLIAAAPDLLEALAAVLRLRIYKTASDVYEHMPWDEIEAAIRKARGGQ